MDVTDACGAVNPARVKAQRGALRCFVEAVLWSGRTGAFLES
jgi:hypothetical protein